MADEPPTNPGHKSAKFPPRPCPKCGGGKATQKDCSLCDGAGEISHFKAAQYLVQHDTPAAMPAVKDPHDKP